MARSSDPPTAATTEEEEEIWGTWEELLLACAVNRHGAHSWDSVASEVRSRSHYADLLTADNCRRRYRLLHRRFSDLISGRGDEIDGEEAAEPAAVEIPWLDELRKLRVAELRLEVQRYDVSIGSLQLKLKKLKEERERSLRESEAEAGDVVANGSGSGFDPKENTDQQKDRTKSLPVKASGDRISGEDSGRSRKESNSTEPKGEEEVKAESRIKVETDPAVNGSGSGSRADLVAGAAASYNGSSDTFAKGAARSPAVEPNPLRNNSGESVAESKGGDEEEEGTKESSDVQSSASLSRRRRGGRRRRIAAALTEPESEAQSPVRKAVDIESQPLIAFLETVRASKVGSVFDRRLESQESVRYRSLIRRHVDLEMVGKRIGRSGYASAEFFRDLLLLCNNALVFYPKNSPESIAAVNLRNLINKEIAATMGKTPQPSPQSAKEPTPPPTAQPPLPLAVKPKSDPDRGSAPLEKPAPLPPLVACRKRSSISGKPAKPTKKVEKEEKKVVREEQEESEQEVEEKVVEKKTAKQQRTAVSRGLRTNKTRSNGKGGGGEGEGGSGTKNLNLVLSPRPEPAEQETKSGGGGSVAKKKSAADFLNRMKSSSPSSPNGKLAESLKSSSGSRRGGGGEKKRKPSSKEENKKEGVSASKRSVGRPPKRAAAPPAKRPREEKTPPLPKKRGRR